MVADDHDSFRDAARLVIDATDGFVHSGEAASGEEALDLITRCPADLVVMDVRMPGIGGVEAARRLAAERPEAAVLLVSAHDMAGLEAGLAGSIQARFADKRDFGPTLLRSLRSSLP